MSQPSNIALAVVAFIGWLGLMIVILFGGPRYNGAWDDWGYVSLVLFCPSMPLLVWRLTKPKEKP